jgi:hypothetical protein
LGGSNALAKNRWQYFVIRRVGGRQLQVAYLAHGALEYRVMCGNSWCGGGTGRKALVAICQPGSTVSPNLQVVGAVGSDIDSDRARAKRGVCGTLDARCTARTSEWRSAKVDPRSRVVGAIAQQHEVVGESVDTRDGRRWVNARTGYLVDARRACDLLDSSQKTDGGFECRHAKF